MPRSSRQGVFHALLRRETGSPLARDRNVLLSYVEDCTVTSCMKEKSCDLPGSPKSTFLVSFSPDRSKMASTHGDHSIRIIDSYTGKYLRTLQGHPRTPWCIAFHPSANDLVASGCLGGEVRIWDLMGGCEVYTPPDRAVIASLAFHPIEHVLLIATSNKLFFWRWDQRVPFACLQTNFLEEKVRMVKFSPFGDYILTGITNITQSENGAGAQNSSQAPINQLLQSVSCTQLDSDQVTQYIVRPAESQATSTASPSQDDSRSTATGQHESPSSSCQGPSMHMQQQCDIERQTMPGNQQNMDGNQSVGQQSVPAITSPMHSNLQQILSNQDEWLGSNQQEIPENRQQCGSAKQPIRSRRGSRPRGNRDYRGVFAIFRARGGGSWNLDTSEVDGESTDVERTSLVFNQTDTTESMSFGQVDNDENPSDRVSDVPIGNRTSSSIDNTRHGALYTSQERPSSRHSSSSLTSVPNRNTNVLSTPNTSSSSRTVTSLSSVTSSSELLSPYPSNLPNNQDQRSDSLQGNNSSEHSNRPSADTPAESFRYDSNINDGASDSNAAVAMDTADSSRTESGGTHSRSGLTTSSDVTVSMDTAGLEAGLSEEGAIPDQGFNANGDRLVSGVGSVFNVGGVSSRTSYVSHGSNYSSSLSTLSSQEGSGTAIATATARTFRHVHTAVVVANGSNGGPQVALRTAINRAIAGAFAGSGEGAVASNINNTTHRLQWWDFSKINMPDLQNASASVVVPCCKIHNDASVDISADGTLLASFVPSALGFPDDGMLSIYSLNKDILGQCLFTKKFGPNAISVSLSSLNSYVMVGLAAKRIHWHLTSRQMMAQIFKLESDKQANDDRNPTELQSPVHSIVLHDNDNERRMHVSVNAAFWHPEVGCGLVYGTNRGDLKLVRRAVSNPQPSDTKSSKGKSSKAKSSKAKSS